MYVFFNSNYVLLYCITQIFQPRNRDIWKIMEFVAETAKYGKIYPKICLIVAMPSTTSDVITQIT